ncbi:acyl carrier protein [Diaphorobacter aerolatus]|uniref:Acyl carrier protein n=1 Tax=Diaphorobacter aerolatus TaxID=1288495 RepID=A0A7H0GPU4_9BURK|nr:acyl carrier protein [Diaphorobacter aerolatus]QNP50310.1 acyl carrier protein [Diaphorobacter aerolatus]
MSMNEIESRAASLIEGIIMTPVDADTLLIDSGLVDSLSAVDVTLAVEREFGVKIPPSEIDVHLQSVQTLAQYIQARAQV